MNYDNAYQAFLSDNNLDRTEGTEAVRNLTVVAETLGYRNTGFACGDIISQFLSDNPGLMEAIHAWIGENMLDEWADALGLNEEIEE